MFVLDWWPFLSNLTSGWPKIYPTWPSTPTTHYTLVRGPFQQIWWPWGIPKQFDSMLYDLWPHERTSLWSRVLPTKFCRHRAFLSNFTRGWLRLTPEMHYTFWSGVLPIKFGCHMAFLKQFDIRMTFDWSHFEKLTTNVWAHSLPPYQVSPRCIEALRNAYPPHKDLVLKWDQGLHYLKLLSLDTGLEPQELHT